MGTESDVNPHQLAESAASRGPACCARPGYDAAHGCQPERHRVQAGPDSCAAPVRAAAVGHAVPSSQRAAPPATGKRWSCHRIQPGPPARR